MWSPFLTISFACIYHSIHYDHMRPGQYVLHHWVVLQIHDNGRYIEFWITHARQLSPTQDELPRPHILVINIDVQGKTRIIRLVKLIGIVHVTIERHRKSKFERERSTHSSLWVRHPTWSLVRDHRPFAPDGNPSVINNCVLKFNNASNKFDALTWRTESNKLGNMTMRGSHWCDCVLIRRG